MVNLIQKILQQSLDRIRQLDVPNLMVENVYNILITISCISPVLIYYVINIIPGIRYYALLVFAVTRVNNTQPRRVGVGGQKLIISHVAVTRSTHE